MSAAGRAVVTLHMVFVFLVKRDGVCLPGVCQEARCAVVTLHVVFVFHVQRDGVCLPGGCQDAGCASCSMTYFHLAFVFPADVRLLPGHVEFGMHVCQHDLQERTLLPWTRQLRPGTVSEP